MSCAPSNADEGDRPINNVEEVRAPRYKQSLYTRISESQIGLRKIRLKRRSGLSGVWISNGALTVIAPKRSRFRSIPTDRALNFFNVLKPTLLWADCEHMVRHPGYNVGPFDTCPLDSRQLHDSRRGLGRVELRLA